MPTVSVDSMIGHAIVAAENVTAYSGHVKSAKSKVIKKNDLIGTIYSWVKDPDKAGNVYWMFPEAYGGGYFYVKHDVNRLKLQPGDAVKSEEEKLKEKLEQQKKEDMGTIPYYLERYGKPVLILTGAALAVKLGVAYMNRNKQQ